MSLRASRLRLYGKKSKQVELIDEISKLLNGTSARRPYPLSAIEIASLLNCSRTTVYNYIKKGRGLPGIPGYKPNGRLTLPAVPRETEFRRFNKEHPITSDPLVAEWMEDLLTRKGGDAIKSWRVRLRSVESVCNACHIVPAKLLLAERQTEKILREYIQLYRLGKAEMGTRGRKEKADIRNVAYIRVQGVRDFCRFYGTSWPRGASGIMSQKVPNHGKYSDIRLSEDELEKADQFIKQQWGVDSDIYRWFWTGIETCARFSALYTMSLDYTKHITKSEKPVYIMTVIESKTKEVRGGKWYKYITRQDTQKSIDLLKLRGGTKIYESTLPKSLFRKEISDKLSMIYRKIGKTTGYFFRHQNHALRHIDAHYWLSKKDYNFGLAKIGGWNTIDELKKSYDQIPPEKILEMIEN